MIGIRIEKVSFYYYNGAIRLLVNLPQSKFQPCQSSLFMQFLHEEKFHFVRGVSVSPAWLRSALPEFFLHVVGLIATSCAQCACDLIIITTLIWLSNGIAHQLLIQRGICRREKHKRRRISILFLDGHSRKSCTDIIFAYIHELTLWWSAWHV